MLHIIIILVWYWKKIGDIFMIVNALLSVFYVFYNCYALFCIFESSGKEIHKWDIKFSVFIDGVHEINLSCGQTEEVAKSMIAILSKISLILWKNPSLDFDSLHITSSILLFSKKMLTEWLREAWMLMKWCTLHISTYTW